MRVEREVLYFDRLKFSTELTSDPPKTLRGDFETMEDSAVMFSLSLDDDVFSCFSYCFADGSVGVFLFVYFVFIYFGVFVGQRRISTTTSRREEQALAISSPTASVS